MHSLFVSNGSICMLVVKVVSNRLGTQSVIGSQSMIAGVLHESTRAEQRAVVRFLWAKGLSTEVRPMYGDNCFSRKTVFNWIQEFNKGRQSIRGRKRPAEVSTEATMQRVQQINSNDRCVSIDDIAGAVGYSHGTTYIVHEQLKFHKVCARWVPHRYTEVQKCSEWVCPCSTSIGTLRK